MTKTRPPYSPEFRRQMVELVRAGRDPDDLAREKRKAQLDAKFAEAARRAAAGKSPLESLPRRSIPDLLRLLSDDC
jgi:transposase